MCLYPFGSHSELLLISMQMFFSYCSSDVGSRCVPQKMGVQGKPEQCINVWQSLAFVTNGWLREKGWLCVRQLRCLGELCGLMWPSASPKHHLYVSLLCPCVYVFTVCLYGSILWDMAVTVRIQLWFMPAFGWLPEMASPPSFPVAFQRSSWA